MSSTNPFNYQFIFVAKLVTAVFLLMAPLVNAADREVKKSTTSSWVKDIEISDGNISVGELSYQYLLLDFQDNISLEEQYRHYAVKVSNAEGIQAMSDINVTYDPEFQSLIFHKIEIHRGDEPIEKLQEAEIKVIQRETSLERSLYDGSLSAVANLSDVREGDVIEYAYTIRGFNPINEGNFAMTYYHQYSIPVDRIYNRLLALESTNIDYKSFLDAEEPKFSRLGKYKVYEWDNSGLDFQVYDNNIPSWYDSQMRTMVTTYDSWSDIVDWAIDIYDYSKQGISETVDEIGTSDQQKMRILEYIRFVQDDVRYLGFESGIGAYKPNSPQKVLSNKYGDCKDKSLLLVALLREDNVEAYPMLVNSFLKTSINDYLPSVGTFDHCVVKFKLDGEDYFIDPTIAGQGGDLSSIYFPPYGAGLIIKPGESHLTLLPKSINSSVNIKEIIDINTIGESADYVIRTEYTGSRADNIRTIFESNTLASIEKDYLNYYSGIYPSILKDSDLKYFDYDRNSINKVIVEEHYIIEEFWKKLDEASNIRAEISPIVLEHEINYPNTSSRSMPYYLGEPFSYFQNTQINLPEEWNVTNSELSIEGEGFQYENMVRAEDNFISITNVYQRNAEYIEPEAVKGFSEKHEQISNQLNFQLTYNQNYSEFSTSYLSVFIALIAVCIGAYFAIQVNKNYDPSPWEYAENKTIGGWLILPAIGVSFTLIVLIPQILSDELFNSNLWLGVASMDWQQSIEVAIFVGGEIFYNFLLFIFSILVIIQFYKRRTSLIRLITIFYIVNLMGPIIDHLLAMSLFPDQLSDADNQETLVNGARAIVVAAIWIPYFNLSERSKSTFCLKYGQRRFGE